jgi:hypothetical protein
VILTTICPHPTNLGRAVGVFGLKRTGFLGPPFRIAQLARGFWRKDCLDGNSGGDGFWSGNDGPRGRSRRSVVR